MGTALGGVLFVVLLLFAIGFHEFGHYITAKRSGIKITKFFIGFGPTLWSVRRGVPETVLVDSRGRPVEDPGAPGAHLETRPETEYGVKLLPIGGYVKVLGMSPFEEIRQEDYARSFAAASGWKRAIVLVAGSVTHFVTAFVAMLVIFSVIGVPTDRPTLRVDAVYRDVGGKPGPAFAAGIRPGDRIVAVDGAPVQSWNDVRARIRASGGHFLHVTVETPSGQRHEVTVTPVVEKDETGKEVGIIGVAPTFVYRRANPIVGAARSVRFMGELTVSFVKVTPRAFAPRNLGLLPGRAPTTDRPLSIYGAGKIAAGLAARGQVSEFLFFFAQLNLFIGIFNLMPLPPLDGGHLLMLLIEKVRRKPVDPRKLLPVMAVVTSLLIVLGLSLLFQDIFSPVANPFQ